MKIQYIFIKKEKATVNTKNSNKFFQDMFKSIFDAVTFDTFQLTLNDTAQTITYKSNTSNNDVTYLTLSYEGKPSFSAKVLAEVNHRLLSGKHRKDFYIINSYDEPSAYYCEKLAPRLGKFERLMRSFIYTSLTKSLGIKWFETSFTDETKTILKDKGNISNTDLIERGLYEMTFAQLYDFLFKEFSYCSPESVLYEQLLNQNLDKMEKSDIILILNSCKKESLWSRFFKNADFDLEGPLHNMREYRNKVAHNKFVNHSEYNNCKRNLIKINTTLENAIEQLNSDIYTEKHLVDTVMSFSALFAGLLKSNYDMVAAMQKSFSALGQTLIKAFESYSRISEMSSIYKLGTIFSDLQKVSSALQTNVKPCEAIPDFYNSPKPEETLEFVSNNSTPCIPEKNNEIDENNTETSIT